MDGAFAMATSQDLVVEFVYNTNVDSHLFQVLP